MAGEAWDRRRWLRLAAGSGLAFFTFLGHEGPSPLAKRQKHRSKPKRQKKPDTEWWEGTWTTYHGTAMSFAGTLTLQQQGTKVTGTFVDADGVSLPFNTGAVGDKGRQLLGLMYNAHLAISVELTLVSDLSFSGYYYVSGVTNVPWTGFKQ